MSQLRLGWRDNPDAHRLALSYASSKPVREASEESPRTKRAHWGVQSRPHRSPQRQQGGIWGQEKLHLMVPVHSPHIAIYGSLREFVAVFCIIHVYYTGHNIIFSLTEGRIP